MKKWFIVHSSDSLIDNPRMIGFPAKKQSDGTLLRKNGNPIPLFKKISELKSGDKIVYYCKGDCVLKGIYDIARSSYAKEKKWPDSPFQFEIKPVITLDEPYNFIPLVNHLDLFKHLKNKKLWGSTLQGKYNSIKPLTEHDYKLIEKSIKQYKKKPSNQEYSIKITSEKIMSDKVKNAILSGIMKLPDNKRLRCDIAIREMGFRNCQFDVIGYNKDENTMYIFECKLNTNITTIGQAFGQLLGYKAVLKERGHEFLSRFYDKYHEEVSNSKVLPKIRWNDWNKIIDRKKINFKFFVVFKEQAKELAKEINSIKNDIKFNIGVLSVTKDGACTPHLTWKKEIDDFFISTDKIEIPLIKEYSLDDFFNELQYKIKNCFSEIYPKFRTNKYTQNQIIQFKISANTHYEVIVKRKEIELGFHIEANKVVTDKIFTFLLSKKKDINRVLGNKIEYNGQWGKSYAKIFEIIPKKTLNQNLLEIVYGRIKKYIEVIQPILDKYEM